VRLHGILARYERRSLLTLLYAAALSPTASHRLPSVAVAFAALGRVTKHGTEPAAAKDLADVLEAAQRSKPKAGRFEDFLGGDPRHDVGVFFGDRRWRLHPSTFEHPLSVIDDLQLLAAVDPLISERFGYGTQDVLAVALAAGDAQMAAMNASWQHAPPPSTEARPYVTDHEVDAARAMLERGVVAADPMAEWFPWPTDSSQASALRASTGAIHLGLERRKPLFGGNLAYHSPAGALILPASTLLDSAAGVCEQMVTAVANDPLIGPALREVRQRRVARAITLLRGVVVESSDGPGGLHATVQMTDRRHISVRNPTTREEFDAAVGEATTAYDRDGRPSASADVVHLVLTDGTPNLSAGRGLIVTDVASFAASVRDLDAVSQWHFLADIAYHDGIDVIAAADLWDCLHAWERHHAFPPGVADAPAVRILPDPTRTSWEDSAHWAPYDDVLVRAGLPASRRFGARRTHEDSTAVLVPTDVSFWALVSLSPPLAVLSLADPATELGDSTYGLADAILLAAKQMPEFADLIVPPNSEPLRLLSCEVVPDIQMPGQADEETVASQERLVLEDFEDAAGDARDRSRATFSVSEDRRQLSISVNRAVLETIAEEPEEGHELVGDLLATSFEVALRRPAELVDAFRDAWARSEPIIRFEFFETTTRHAPVLRTRLHPAAEGWARRQLACRNAARSGVIFSGSEATAVCRKEICPTLIALVDELIEPVDRRMLLHMALSELDRAWAARLRLRRSLDMAREAPWAEKHHVEGVRTERLDGLLCRASEIAVERVVVAGLPTSPGAGRMPDLVDWSRALALAANAAETAQLVGGATAGLHSLVVTFDEFSCFDAFDTGPSRHDESAYQATLLAERIAGEPAEPAPVRSKKALDAVASGTDVPFIRFPREDKLLAAIDDELAATLGFGFDAILALLGEAVSRPPADGVVSVDREDLIDSAAEWTSLPREAIDAATGFLTLDAEGLRSSTYEFWKLDKRSQRLAARPFISDGTRILYSPHRVRWTQELCLAYMSDGRLPWPRLPDRVRKAVERWRQERNRLLERDVEGILKALSMKARRNVKPDLFAKYGVSVAGEVDVLAADETTGTLWVLEVKDFQIAFGPAEIAAMFDKLHGPGGFIERLLERAASVERSARNVAVFLGSAREGPWTVRPLVVTRAIERAAFVAESQAPIVPAGGLRRWMTETRSDGH
jgi:hypothetical protein